MLQERMFAAPADRDPAAAGLQLFHQCQELLFRGRVEDGTGNVDDVRLEHLHQAEVFQAKLDSVVQSQGRYHALTDAHVGGNQVDTERVSAEHQSRREQHLAASTPHVEKLLARLQACLSQDVDRRLIRGLAIAKIPERPIRLGPALQKDVQGQEAADVVEPVQSLHPQQARMRQQRAALSRTHQ